MLAGKRELAEPLAGKSTLNRMELVPSGSLSEQRYHKITYSQDAIDQLLVDVFLESQERAPAQIILDLDATDMPLYGNQEGRFFHGYYGHYCYLPLYIFCGDHLLCARLRSSNIDASAGSLQEVQRIVRQIRGRWPKTRIILRADSGFCREELMSWCEQQRVEYVFGFARNKRLRRRIAPAMRAAKQQYRRTGKPTRVFTEFRYRTRKSWSRARRVIAKAEQIAGKENPRYIVTSLMQPEWAAQALYEQLYCARGEMENRIKEQLSLFADRMSTETLRSNQLRLYLSSMAYVLVHALRYALPHDVSGSSTVPAIPGNISTALSGRRCAVEADPNRSHLRCPSDGLRSACPQSRGTHAFLRQPRPSTSRFSHYYLSRA
jgi:hypothetical protein